MSYVRMNHTDADDERWIEAGADAFALHFAAIVWCDRQLSEGRISRAMASRVSLAVPPERVPDALAALVAAGFWTDDGDAYLIVDFHEHAFPADQVKRTRERWKADKDRRRQHALGDHSLCKDPKYCPAISTKDSTVESEGGATSGRSHLYQTRPDQTRPDKTRPLGRGLDGDGRSAATAAEPSARATGSAPDRDPGGDNNPPRGRLTVRMPEGYVPRAQREGQR